MIGPGGQLPSHVLRFARVLRASGLRIGPGRVLDAVHAAAAVGLAREDEFYWALHAALVSRADERALFDEAFRVFWRVPEAPVAGLELVLPRAEVQERARRDVTRRLAEALARPRDEPPARLPARGPAAAATFVAWSDREALRTKDFEQMSAAELAEAERVVATLALPLPDLPTRRLRADPAGSRLDLRATLRAQVRAPSALPLRWREPRTRPPEVVALCDVSGSMARYSRVLLRFLHALAARGGARVHAFTFATRLTDVSRHLRHRDPDAALAAIGRAVTDWEGGTRIGAALRAFNLRWARRLLGQGALVLLVTDGLDREDARGVAAEAGRLRRSCRRLVWLNPLLRFAGFEARAAGVKALLPEVDEHRPVHDLESLAGLAAALRAPTGGRAAPRTASGARPRRR